LNSVFNPIPLAMTYWSFGSVLKGHSNYSIIANLYCSFS
jgi:hypothetical protein